MTHLVIKNKNEVYVTIDSEEGILYELREYFTFMVPGATFSPQYKKKLWDGKIRLFNVRSRELYRGLIHQVIKFCEINKYTYEYENSDNEFSVLEAQEFIKELGLPEKFAPRDYQIDGFVHAIRSRRKLLLSPTGSGKSLILYLLIRKLMSDGKILIIVPTINLVSQLSSDFKDYGFDSEIHIHSIYAGLDKESNKTIVISTWQSLYKLPESYFAQFNTVISDECHLAKAKSITDIMTKLTQAQYRIGTTGTLDGTKTHKLVLEGLFGETRKITTTKELMDNQTLSDFNIKCILLKHDQNKCELYKKAEYHDEIDYLINSKSRNNFIRNLALSLKGNTLILFQYIKHGEILRSLIEEKGKQVFFIYGKTESEVREETRAIIETEENAIILASVGVFSLGVNIKNLHSVIFASPSKSRIRVLQSIGRVLRRSDTKTNSVLFDIADDMIYKKHQNFTFKHFSARLQYYAEEKFKFKLYKVSLKEI